MSEPSSSQSEMSMPRQAISGDVSLNHTGSSITATDRARDGSSTLKAIHPRDTHRRLPRTLGVSISASGTTPTSAPFSHDRHIEFRMILFTSFTPTLPRTFRPQTSQPSLQVTGVARNSRCHARASMRIEGSRARSCTTAFPSPARAEGKPSHLPRRNQTGIEIAARTSSRSPRS